MNEPHRNRISELLAERATQGLDLDGAAELGELLGEHRDVDEHELDRAAAAVSLALLPATDTLPASLRTRLVRDAGEWTRRDAYRTERPPGSGVLAFGGWLLAAASLLIVVLTRPLPGGEPGRTDAASERGALLETGAGVRLAWSSTEDPLGAGASGDVVWSDELQRGYMRFRGLAPNDPREHQYQLWIFDEQRPPEHPVDGGVFDVPADGEVVVPIDAKLPVDHATLFAVTLERPGGVVVSSREHLLLTAAAE